MDLKQQLADDLRTATRAHDALRLSAIRMLRAAIQTLEIARTDPKDPKHGEPVTEQDLVVAIQKEVNQRKEALEFAQKAGREDLITKEEQTIAVMQGYLPRALSREEIAAEVKELMAELGTEFRKVMPAASARMRGRADGKLVAEIVRELTEGGAAGQR
jgi:uncharacterized protein YqeY